MVNINIFNYSFREYWLSLSKSFQPSDKSLGVETLKLTTPDSRPSSISRSSFTLLLYHYPPASCGRDRQY